MPVPGLSRAATCGTASDRNFEATATLFARGRYQYRCWVTNRDLSPAGVQHFYDGRATLEVRIRELRQDFALTRIPTRRFAANALYLEIVRLAL